MPYVRDDSKLYSLGAHRLASSTTTDAATELETCVLGDDFFSPHWTRWEVSSNLSSKSLDVLLVQGGAAFSRTLSSLLSCIAIGQALLLGAFESSLFDKKPLAFIPPARATPLQHDGTQR